MAGADLLLVANDDYRVYPVNFGGHAYGDESVVAILDICQGHFCSCYETPCLFVIQIDRFGECEL